MDGTGWKENERLIDKQGFCGALKSQKGAKKSGGMSGGEDKSEKLECCCSGCLDCSRESSGESGSGNGNEEEENGRNGKVGWGDVLEFQLKHLGQRGTWLAIILGQVLSVLLCVMAFATVHLVEVYKVYVPNGNFLKGTIQRDELGLKIIYDFFYIEAVKI